MKTPLTTFGLCIVLLLSACSTEDDLGNPGPNNPENYNFIRNGNTTVDYNGQTTRILMGNDLSAALTDETQTEAQLYAKYAHTQGNSNFSSEQLNNSDKNLRSKTAASRDYYFANSTVSNEIKNQFDTWIEKHTSEVIPAWNNDAAPGVAGQIQEAGGGPIRHINAKGLEYNQAIIKGLIGAVMTDQMLNNYLSPAVLDEANNRVDQINENLVPGKNYTTMEHKWDEAFGYLYGTDDPLNPQLGQDEFLSKYLGRLENDTDFTGTADRIYQSFIAGRAAIVDNDFQERDAQAEIIKGEISKLIGVRAVYYLIQGKNNIEANDLAAAFHDLSEGYGFIMSLQFTRMPQTDSPYFTKTEVDAYLNQLMAGNGFWDVDTQDLETMAAEIADRFPFSIEQAQD